MEIFVSVDVREEDMNKNIQLIFAVEITLKFLIEFWIIKLNKVALAQKEMRRETFHFTINFNEIPEYIDSLFSASIGLQ